MDTIGWIHIQPAIHVFEVVLLGFFIQRLQASTFLRKPLEIKIVRGIAISLSLLYAFLLFLVLGSKFVSEKFNFFLQEIFQWVAHQGNIGAGKEEFLSAVISGNIQLLHETMGWSYIVFYGLTFLLVACFVRKNIPGWFPKNTGIYFSLFLLVINISLAWSIHPLNKEPLIWERQDFTKGSSPIKIRAYDRIAKVNPPTERCKNEKVFIDCVKIKVLDGEFGPRRWVVGYRLPHGLDFTGLKSFSQKEVALMVTKFLEIDGLNIKAPLRYLETIPAYSSFKIYDFSGVKYFASAYPLPTSEKIKLIYSSFQFYLYQNMDTWPYFYLADRIETINNVKELYNAEKGVAYLWEDHRKINFPDSKPEREKLIELTSFKYGNIKFHSASYNEEFLVVADAWHQYWRALVDGEEVEVLKTNGVFKGVFVPPGDHKIQLFFDNEPYRPGIWISIFSWILFIGGWAGLSLKYSN